MKSIIFLYIWVLFNIFIGIYEIYCYLNRNKLSLDTFPKWNSSIIHSWNEYCRVDPRYILKNHHYVWYFELLNAFYAFILIFLLFIRFTPFRIEDVHLIKYILLLEIISCSLYFITLFFEFLFNTNISHAILENSTITNRIIYYGISSIWICIPVYLYIHI